MADFDEYCRTYLEQWEQRAAVRGRSRTRLTPQSLQGEMYPTDMIMVLKHKSVEALGAKTARELMIRTACEFMEHVASLEVQVVGDLCGKLANAGMGAPLPESASQVALTVATDEVYHAFVAREFLTDVERLTGISIPAPGETDLSILVGLRAVQREAPAALLRPAETMALCFAENFVTEELFGLSRETDPKSMFHVLLREHMVDEGRHQVFFQRLLRHLWQGLAEADRAAIGRLVPVFLDAFLDATMRSFRGSTVALLGVLGFDGQAAQKIYEESLAMAYGTEIPAKHKMISLRNLMNLVEVSGVLQHEPTRRAMADRGWADA